MRDCIFSIKVFYKFPFMSHNGSTEEPKKVHRKITTFSLWFSFPCVCLSFVSLDSSALSTYNCDINTYHLKIVSVVQNFTSTVPLLQKSTEHECNSYLDISFKFLSQFPTLQIHFFLPLSLSPLYKCTHMYVHTHTEHTLPTYKLVKILIQY